MSAAGRVRVELEAVAEAFDAMRPSRTAELGARVDAAARAVEAGRRLLEELGADPRIAFAVDVVATAAALRAFALARFPADAQRVEASLERFACQARELAAKPRPGFVRGKDGDELDVRTWGGDELDERAR